MTTPDLPFTRRKEYLVYSCVRDSFQEYEDEISLVLFSPKCNFRCPTCTNKILWNPTISFAQTLDDRFLEHYLTPMTTALVFLGGEPCIYGDGLVDAARRVRAYNPSLKLKVFTNGMFPDVLRKMVDNHLLDSASIDFKTVDSFQHYLGIPISEKEYLDTLSDSFDVIYDAGLPLEIRTTAFPDLNLPEIRSVVEDLWPDAKYIVQQPIQPPPLPDEKDLILPQN